MDVKCQKCQAEGLSLDSPTQSKPKGISFQRPPRATFPFKPSALTLTIQQQQQQQQGERNPDSHRKRQEASCLQHAELQFPVPLGRRRDREDCHWLNEMERIMTRVGQGSVDVPKPCRPCTRDSKTPSSQASSREVQQKITEDDVRILKEKLRDLSTNEHHGEDVDMEMIHHIAEAISSSGSSDDGSTSNVELTFFDQVLEAPPKGEELSAADHIRRTAVALTGSTLTAAGVALIPCPVIPGALFIYGGLLVLATEFDDAKVALESLKEPLTNFLADEVGRPPTDKDRFNRAAWEGIIDYTPKVRCGEIDEEFAALMMESEEDDDAISAREAERRNKNRLKQVVRRILLLDQPKHDAKCGSGQT